MTAEEARRERYAVALYRTLGFSAERHPWAGLSPARRDIWYQRAEAAMAVADEEIAEGLAAAAANAAADTDTDSTRRGNAARSAEGDPEGRA
ncbi:hypothetical protein [Streptomyces axinellae]|uniref:Uncharacterized protein n=1 Tax=Streptomyces axinellae TaxID=552788 RepID=A0ABN3QAI5_9ACTN